MESSDWTTRQVDQVPHADPVGDFPQFRAAGRVEAAHQTIAAELFPPVLPALGAQTQPLEDPGQLLRDRGFSLAKESARIFDQNAFQSVISVLSVSVISVSVDL